MNATVFKSISLDQLHESPLNPRRHYNPVALKLLADNLAIAGQLTPVLVRPRPRGGYELAAGHRRTRAATLAGLSALDAIVRDMDDAQFIECLNIENLQRDDLNALEEAEGFKSLMTGAGYDVPKIAERVGRSVKYVYDRLKLLALIPEAKKLLEAGTITPGHGILLARLTKADQKRALDPDNGGVLEGERISGNYFPTEAPGLELGDAKKARSVRELQQWIAREVRFDPDQVDRGDLEFDLPHTAGLLELASATELKVIKITREYRVPDAARDEKERTYGQQSWQRADGEPEPFDRYGATKKAKPSKTCEYSVVGLVVAGPGRGEAFMVCVNKDKCAVHWEEEMKQRAKSRAARERAAAQNGGNGAAPAAAAKVDPDVLPDDLRETWLGELLVAGLPEIVKRVKAVIDELKISDEICWNLVQSDLYMDRWNKVGRTSWAGARGTQHDDELERLLVGELPGKFEGDSLRATDGPGARTELAWKIWLIRDSEDLDAPLEKAITARWAAHRKAAAKEAPPVQTSAKPAKRRAGDVAREKKLAR